MIKVMPTEEALVCARDVLADRAPYACLRTDGFALARSIAAAGLRVGHTIADPPYDEHTHKSKRTNRNKNKGGVAGSDIDFPPLPPVASFLPGLIEATGRWLLLFCPGTMLGEYLAAGGGYRSKDNPRGAFIRDGVYHRTNPTPQKTGDRPGQPCESIAILHQPSARIAWHGGGRQAFWEGPVCSDPRRLHPTKKPLWLMEALVLDFTDPDDVIFDLTAGEGTTGEAAIRHGRRVVLCELSRKYHAAAADRCARAWAAPKVRPLLDARTGDVWRQGRLPIDVSRPAAG